MRVFSRSQFFLQHAPSVQEVLICWRQHGQHWEAAAAPHRCAHRSIRSPPDGFVVIRRPCAHVPRACWARFPPARPRGRLERAAPLPAPVLRPRAARGAPAGLEPADSAGQ